MNSRHASNSAVQDIANLLQQDFAYDSQPDRNDFVHQQRLPESFRVS